MRTGSMIGDSGEVPRHPGSENLHTSSLLHLLEILTCDALALLIDGVMGRARRIN